MRVLLLSFPLTGFSLFCSQKHHAAADNFSGGPLTLASGVSGGPLTLCSGVSSEPLTLANGVSCGPLTLCSGVSSEPLMDLYLCQWGQKMKRAKHNKNMPPCGHQSLMRTCCCADNRAWWEHALVETSELDENVLMWTSELDEKVPLCRHQSLTRTCHCANNRAWWEHAIVQTSRLDENMPLCRHQSLMRTYHCADVRWGRKPSASKPSGILTCTIAEYTSHKLKNILTRTVIECTSNNILYTRNVIFCLRELSPRKVTFYYGYSGMPTLYGCGTLLSRYECHQGALYSLFSQSKYTYNYNGLILVGWLRKNLLHSQCSQNSHHKNQEELYML